MKTKKCHRKTVLLWSVLFFLQSFSLSSQRLHTVDWKTFVESSSNYLLCDTFLRQTFEEKTSDLWIYSTTGNTSVFNASKAGVKGQEGNNSLKLPSGSSVRFDNPFFGWNTLITVKFAARNLKKNDGLRLSFPVNNELSSVIWALSKRNGFNIDYGQQVDGEPGHGAMSNPIQLKQNLQSFILESISTQTADEECFFCIDEVYIYGEIPCYSLFSGKGDWMDINCWSHLPPTSKSNVLLEGTARLAQTVNFKELHLKGELTLEEGGVCKVDNCYLYDKGGFNFRGGTIVIENKISTSLELPEKNKWYFFSLPFDVYPEGLDEAIQWGKGITNENGNFFYLMTYNSESRAKNGFSSSNWQQLSPEKHQADKPIIEKCKGYLIAVDENSKSKQLTFTSRAGKKISYSGEDLIRLEVFEGGMAGQEHQGWYLCGNPFPAPLLFKHINMNEKLDGYVYLYEEDDYHAYPLNGNYGIPPYTAFFVKASGCTELDIQLIGESGPDYRLPAFIPYKISGDEPKDKYVLESGVKDKSAPGFLFKKEGRKLIFQNISFPAWLYIADISGNMVFRCELTEDSILLPLHIPPGIYIACVYTNSLRNQYKFILNE